tara:strand:+ start:4374 stop:4547 length:174 start_codon:yes stop_codon:yes gene_type:complete
MDWEKAEEYLKECETAYSETGSAGMFCMLHVIAPCRDRFNKGERTEALYDDIFGIAL